MSSEDATLTAETATEMARARASSADAAELAENRGENEPATPPDETPDELAPDRAPDVETPTGQGDLLTDEELLQSVTALVFASPEPISDRRLVTLLDGPQKERVQQALDALRERLVASGLPLELRALAGGWQVLTAPQLGDVVQRLFKARKAERVSAAALETLSVVAYRQPVSKAEIEAIRGVQAGPILRTLIDRDLVRVTGRADVPGHPLQYGTTRGFLDRFGLGNLDELPRDSELAKD